MAYETCDDLSTVTTRNYIYYQGVVNSATATILVLDDWSNPEAKRIVATGLRNNAIIATNESNWRAAKQDTGNRTALFEKYQMYENSDSWHITWQNALYFQAHPVPYVTTSDVTVTDCSSSGSDEDSVSMGVLVGSIFSAAVCVILLLVWKKLDALLLC